MPATSRVTPANCAASLPKGTGRSPARFSACRSTDTEKSPVWGSKLSLAPLPATAATGVAVTAQPYAANSMRIRIAPATLPAKAAASLAKQQKLV